MPEKTLQELYAMLNALKGKGFPEEDAARIVVSQTGQRLNDGKPVGSPVQNPSNSRDLG